MKRSRLRRWFVASRDGKQINKVDSAALWMILAGILLGLAGLHWAPAQIGLTVSVLGFLLLIRHHPGGA